MNKTLLLTVGSTEFSTLVESFFHQTLINQLSSSLAITSIYAQVGHSRLPEGWEIGTSEVEGIKLEVVRFTGDLENRVAESNVVISHAGAGSILSFLRPLSTSSIPSSRRLILVPNDTLMDSHQSDLADEMEKYDCVRICRDPKELLKTIEDLGKEEEQNGREGDEDERFPEYDKTKIQSILTETLGYGNSTAQPLPYTISYNRRSLTMEFALSTVDSSLKTHTKSVVQRGHRRTSLDVVWGSGGIYFPSASSDRTARLRITDKIHAVRIFAGHLSDVNCFTFHPNSLYIAIGPWLASAGDDNLIHLWNLSSGTLQKTFTGHTSSIHSLSFSVESTVLLSGSADETVRVWDVLSPPPEQEGSTALVDVKKGRRVTALGGKKDQMKDSKSSNAERENGPCPDLLATLATKRTPVLEVKFSPRNLALAAGAMIESS